MVKSSVFLSTEQQPADRTIARSATERTKRGGRMGPVLDGPQSIIRGKEFHSLISAINWEELEVFSDFAEARKGSVMAAGSQVMVSVSGVRGIVGDGLTPELAMAYASALGVYVNGGPIVVSRDSRPSGEMLRHAIIAGLTASGCQVTDIGIAPTPTCGRAVKFHAAVGGIQITASHNPAPWNGLKLFGPDGAVLPAAEGKRIQDIFDTGSFRRAD